jgi:hypothetical protein
MGFPPSHVSFVPVALQWEWSSAGRDQPLPLPDDEVSPVRVGSPRQELDLSGGRSGCSLAGHRSALKQA